MQRRFLRAKIHRATVTAAEPDYEGSISVDRALCRSAGLSEFEEVDVYDITNGARFTTYIIYGEPGQIQINGAAARLAAPGDIVIIVAYVSLASDEILRHQATVVQIDAGNLVRSVKTSPVRQP